MSDSLSSSRAFADDNADDVGARLAARIHALRHAAGLSLDVLAARSGVSRSAISTIERHEASPTAVVLDKLAGALGVTIASLFDDEGDAGRPSPLRRRGEQTVWRDPSSGYVRRNVSPPGWPSPTQLTEIEFPPSTTVEFSPAAEGVVVQHYVWVLSGEIDVLAGGDWTTLRKGDCLAVPDQCGGFRNNTTRTARYAVVVTTTDLPRTRR